MAPTVSIPENPLNGIKFGCCWAFRFCTQALYVSSADANAALGRAIENFELPADTTAEDEGLYNSVMPLAQAIELVVSGRETRFEFVAPSSSLQWVKEYATRAAKTAGDAASDAEKQAAFEELIQQKMPFSTTTARKVKKDAAEGCCDEC